MLSVLWLRPRLSHPSKFLRVKQEAEELQVSINPGSVCGSAY